jgi:DnaK suppressor protein
VSTKTATATETKRPAAKSKSGLSEAWRHKPGKDLTDAEVLAMPDSEYMNDQQLEFFRAQAAAAA